MKLVILLAGIFLIGCTPRYTTLPPSPALTRDCLCPLFEGETWRDLSEAYLQCKAIAEDCTDRMRKIRE